MKSISSVVENIIKEKPYLEEALAQVLINISSLARAIQPEIEAATKKEVREGAIIMAIKRIHPILQFELENKIKQTIKHPYHNRQNMFYMNLVMRKIYSD